MSLLIFPVKTMLVYVAFRACLALGRLLVRLEREGWVQRNQRMIPVESVPSWWWLVYRIKVEYPPDGSGAILIASIAFIVLCLLIVFA